MIFKVGRENIAWGNRKREPYAPCEHRDSDSYCNLHKTWCHLKPMCLLRIPPKYIDRKPIVD